MCSALPAADYINRKFGDHKKDKGENTMGPAGTYLYEKAPEFDSDEGVPKPTAFFHKKMWDAHARRRGELRLALAQSHLLERLLLTTQRWFCRSQRSDVYRLRGRLGAIGVPCDAATDRRAGDDRGRGGHRGSSGC